MTTPTAPLPAFSASTIRALTDFPGYNTLLSLPPAYEQQRAQAWPLVLFLHGAAERGHDVWAVTRQGLPRLVGLGDELSTTERTIGTELRDRCIVVAPQCPQYEVWNETRLLSLLDAVGRGYRVDRNCVYATGLSLGGFGTWTLAIRHPQRFAAIVPICGGGRIADVLRASEKHREALQSLGIWAFHGANDRVVPREESERMVRALETAGVTDVRLTVYPDVEHDAWTRTYGNPELYAWLFRHHR